jgi:hypothetical protein
LASSNKNPSRSSKKTSSRHFRMGASSVNEKQDAVIAVGKDAVATPENQPTMSAWKAYWVSLVSIVSCDYC